jgi:hypothetical protein
MSLPPKSSRSERRLQAISRYILRHGYTSHDVARALASAALQYTERDFHAAAQLLGIGEMQPELTAADGSSPWLSNGGGLPTWPHDADHD